MELIIRQRNLTLLFCFSSFLTFAQPFIEWQKTYGGSYYESAHCVSQLADSGYVIAGWTNSNNGDITNLHGNDDVWITRVDPSGTLLWQKTLGGTEYESADAIIPVSDSGFVIVGKTSSVNGDVTGNHGFEDSWAVKLSADGTLIWQTCLGGSEIDESHSIDETADGGFILVGSSWSNDGQVSGNHGSGDVWVVKLSNAGVLEWQKCLGGSDYDVGYAIYQTQSGNYMLCGTTNSIDGDVTTNHGTGDVWLVKLDGTGNLLWEKTYGGSSVDIAYDMYPTQDSGFVLAGYSQSMDGDVGSNAGGSDAWVLKLDSLGNIQWKKVIAGSSTDILYAVSETPTGEIVTAGFSSSTNGDVSGNHGIYDYWIVKLSSTGSIIWQKSLGGSTTDIARDLQLTTDGGIVLAGESASNNNDVSGNHGSYDFWVVKLSTDAETDPVHEATALTCFPNPVHDVVLLKISQNLIGKSYLMYDHTGRIVASGKLTGEQTVLNLSCLCSGLYTMIIDQYDGQPLSLLKE